MHSVPDKEPFMIASWASNSGVHATRADDVKMIDPIPICSRCGKPMGDGAFRCALRRSCRIRFPRSFDSVRGASNPLNGGTQSIGKRRENLAAAVHSEGASALAPVFGFEDVEAKSTSQEGDAPGSRGGRADRPGIYRRRVFLDLDDPGVRQPESTNSDGRSSIHKLAMGA